MQVRLSGEVGRTWPARKGWPAEGRAGMRWVILFFIYLYSEVMLSGSRKR